MYKKSSLIVLATLTALAVTDARAAVSADQAAQLKSSLTPMGAEKAGNAAGTIPAWSGGLTSAPAGYKGPGAHHVDPFAGEKPKFVITKANLDQYKANLTAGQIALFNAYPDSYQMPVYETHRTGSAPQWIYDNIYKNATSAKLVEGGNGFSDAYGGVPFPIPKSGVEAVWNHIARYRGTYIVRRSSQAGVQRNGAYSLVTSQDEALFRFYDPKGSYDKLGNTLFYYMTFTTAPARLAGNGALVQETLDQVKEPRQAWGYNPGQRRVRRAPTLAYDTPIEDSDGLRTADDTDMYNGAPDRYDWKLVGKQELYIPYNNYKLDDPKLKYADIIKPGHLNQDLTRYELHRVWHVTATLKPGERHIYAKRDFFIDEDTWQAVEIDHYDGRGTLWRVAEAFNQYYYNYQVPWYTAETLYDLLSGRYLVLGLKNEEKSAYDFNYSASESDFTPAALRQEGVR